MLWFDKNRLSLDAAIKDLAGLEQLIALKKLSIPGHGYSSIDVSALKELEELNLYEAFVRTLDLSRNIHLRSLNVGATAIDDLNLMGLRNLKVLIAAYDGEGFHDSYTPMPIMSMVRTMALVCKRYKTSKNNPVRPCCTTYEYRLG